MALHLAGAVTSQTEGSTRTVDPGGIGVPPRATAVDLTRTKFLPAPRWLAALESWHRAEFRAAVLAIDVILLAIAWWIIGASSVQIGLAAIAFVLLSPMTGLSARRTTVESQGVSWYCRPLAATALAMLFASFVHPEQLTASVAIKGLALTFCALTAARFGSWLVIARSRRRGVGLRPTLIVGTPSRIEQLEQRMATYPEAGLRFAAGYAPTLDDDEAVEDGRTQAFSLLDRGQVEHVLFVSDGIDEGVFRDFTYRADGTKGYTMVLPLAHLSGRKTRYHFGDLGVVPLAIGVSDRGMIGKRVMDVVFSALLLFLTAPVLAATAAAVWLNDRGPVIFRQERVGRHNRPFVMLKFRSMVVGAEEKQDAYVGLNINTGLLFKMHDDPRVTTVGSVIRRLSIDELPQLINVLKGDMSLVGPRPLPVSADQFEEPARARHAVAPGITGPWQVEGGNALAYADMVDLDLTYVTTRSMGYDLMLLARTVPALLNRRSAY